MSGMLADSFGVPGVFYLQSLGFNRYQLVQSMGILFYLVRLFFSTAPEIFFSDIRRTCNAVPRSGYTDYSRYDDGYPYSKEFARKFV